MKFCLEVVAKNLVRPVQSLAGQKTSLVHQQCLWSSYEIDISMPSVSRYTSKFIKKKQSLSLTHN